MTGFPDGPETELPKGDVTEGVVRIGDTVRRPRSAVSEVVAEYLDHLAAIGFDGAPRHLGLDSQGRDVLTFVDGAVPGDPVEGWARADGLLPSVGRLVRRLHDASDGWRPRTPVPIPAGRPVAALPDDEPHLIAHRDVTPQNTVFREGVAVALVDFDLIGETTRSIDLANTAMHWVPLVDPADRAPGYDGIDVGMRLRLLLDGYGRDAVNAQQLLRGARRRFAAGHASMKWNAENLGGGWARMWEAGVGEVIRRRAAWLDTAEDGLRAALR
jgi:hypothetical protein